jgi:hypothetical protein
LKLLVLRPPTWRRKGESSSTPAGTPAAVSVVAAVPAGYPIAGEVADGVVLDGDVVLDGGDEVDDGVVLDGALAAEEPVPASAAPAAANVITISPPSL